MIEKEIKDQILAKENLSKALEPNEDERKELLNKLETFCNNFIDQLENGKAYYENESPDRTKFAIDNQTYSFDHLLEIYTKEVLPHGVNPASGGHLGYIPGGGLFTSALGDYLAAISNEYAGIHFGSPGAVCMETELINWVKSIFGFPKTAIGNLSSGGSIANLIALNAARDSHEISSEKVKKSVIYLSKQVHHCIQKALRIIGLGESNIRYIALDEFHRMQSTDLEKKIAKDKMDGLNPYLIIASAGTTDTGAIDPLDEIANIAKANKMWFHVDAAYGGFFILCDSVKHKFKGIEKADSLVVDPHKGMFLPYGIGIVLVKDRSAMMHSNNYTANYMQDTFTNERIINPADVSPELTKHFRGLRMWLPLKLHGIQPFISCLEAKLLQTKYFLSLLKSHGFQTGIEPDLSVSYFWHETTNIENDLFNKQLMAFIHQDGRVFLSSSIINNKYVIRIAILSFRTKLNTIELGMEMILKARIKTLDFFKRSQNI